MITWMRGIVGGVCMIVLAAGLTGTAVCGERVFSDLDLDWPGLDQVKAAQDDTVRAAELLAYYRARTSIKHPVDRARLATLRGTPLNASSRQVAEDALRNVLVTCPHYPRYDFGAEIDWLRNRGPNGDAEWLWQLNRHGSWNALAWAYTMTGDARYAQCYVRQLLDWIGQCPCDSDSPAWRTIEAGIRGHAWTGHFQHFLDAPSFTPEVLIRFLASLRDHAEFLTRRPMNRGNWGLMEAEGTAFIAMTFPEFKSAAAWRQKAFDHLNAMSQRQIRADGHHNEQCLGYHLGGIDWFARTAQMAADNGWQGEFATNYWQRIESMCAVPARLGFPDGTHAQFGDDHSQFHWRDRIAPYMRLFARDDMLFAATGGRKGRPPAETAFALRESGFYSMRSGWDTNAVMLVLKCGPDGGWHCQPDNGTFEIYAGGRRLTPDSGACIYHGNDQARKDRAWFRQTRVHQTLTLDDRDTAYGAKLLVWQPGPALDLLVVENASYPGLTHRRAVFFVARRYFVVVDEALGEAAGAAAVHFQLAPAPGDAVIDRQGMSARTGFPDGANLLIQAMPQEGLDLVREEGQVSFEYGIRAPRPAVRFEMRKGISPVRFVTVLVPYAGEVPAVRAVPVGAGPSGASSRAWDVTVNGERSRIGYNGNEQL
jgi:heparan-sulfate lyase